MEDDESSTSIRGGMWWFLSIKLTLHVPCELTTQTERKLESSSLCRWKEFSGEIYCCVRLTSEETVNN